MIHTLAAHLTAVNWEKNVRKIARSLLSGISPKQLKQKQETKHQNQNKHPKKTTQKKPQTFSEIENKINECCIRTQRQERA